MKVDGGVGVLRQAGGVPLAAVAQYAEVAAPPHPERPVPLHGGDGFPVVADADALHVFQHPYWVGLVGEVVPVRVVPLVVVADLAELVVPPHPEGAVFFDGGGADVARIDALHVLHHLHGGGLDVAVKAVVKAGSADVELRLEADAQLAVVVAAPHPEGAVLLDGGGDAVADADGGHVLHHPDGHGGVLPGAVAQLSIVVAAPGPEVPLAVHQGGVADAHGERGRPAGLEGRRGTWHRRAASSRQSSFFTIFVLLFSFSALPLF